MSHTPDATRRRFFLGAGGAALAAPLAVAARAGAADETATRLARLEAADAVRALNASFVRSVNARDHAEAAALFADPTRAELDATVVGLAPDPDGEPDAIEVAADARTATARLAVRTRIETPLEGTGTLVEMARAQGDVDRRSERRTLELACVKHNGVWKIASAELVST